MVMESFYFMIGKTEVVSMKNSILIVLKHDLHKIFRSATPHNSSLPDKLMKKADSTASWYSRNFKFRQFSNNPLRLSLIKNKNHNNYREYRSKVKEEVRNLFRESDPYKLHSKILNSRILNLFNEAKTYPYTSLKYHLLLTCALFYNFQIKNKNSKLYLCENQIPNSQFQIIYRDNEREWAILPIDGLSRVLPRFDLTWIRRMKESIGGDRMLDGLLATIKSWSVALSTIEDYKNIIR